MLYKFISSLFEFNEIMSTPLKPWIIIMSTIGIMPFRFHYRYRLRRYLYHAIHLTFITNKGGLYFP